MNPRRILWVVVLLLGATASAQATEVVVYYHTDALHSATTLTNAQGQVIERTHYAPYGQVLNRALRDGPGYAGHEEDAATGLVYMQQRYYDPESGTFLSADPVEANAGAGFNRYAYAANNPYRYIDPDGRQFSVPDCGANGCFPAGTKGTTGTMIGIVADANMAAAEGQSQNQASGRLTGLAGDPNTGLADSNAQARSSQDGSSDGSPFTRENNENASENLGNAADTAACWYSCNGYWWAQNGKWHSQNWGGNGATGSRTAALEFAKRLEKLGRVFGYLSMGMHALDAIDAAERHDKVGVVGSVADFAWGTAGTFGGLPWIAGGVIYSGASRAFQTPLLYPWTIGPVVNGLCKINGC